MQTPGGVVALRSSEIRQLVASRTRACMVRKQEGSLAYLLDFIVCSKFYLPKMFLNLTTLFGRCMINCSTR